MLLLTLFLIALIILSLCYFHNRHSKYNEEKADNYIERINELDNKSAVMDDYSLTEPYPSSFTAIDFETATNSRMACQLGVVRVENNKIIYKKSYLIQPPYNKFDKNTLAHHHIRPDMTESASSFSEQWENIREALKLDTLVAHNIEFDFDVLEKNLQYFDLEMPNFKRKFCTMKMLDNLSLDTACSLFDVPIDNHHDALCDAEACARLLIYYSTNTAEAKGKILSFYNSVKVNSKPLPKKTPNDLSDRTVSKTNKGFCEDIESIPDNYFKGKSCVITGTFRLFPIRDELAGYIKEHGGRVISSISSRTDILLMGEAPGPSKVEKARLMIVSGSNLKIIDETELGNIIKEQG